MEQIHGMSENYPPEAQAFCIGTVDQRAVREYLEVKDDGEIPRLAAMLAPKTKTSDPAALVDAAMNLQKQTTSALIRKREKLVSTMSYPTLLALQEALGTSLSICVEDDDERLLDPILGPVMRRIRSTVSDGLKLGQLLAKDRIAKSLANADKRTKLPRPSLPCDLEEALRYATNSPQVPWLVLRDAFIDFQNLKITDQNLREYNRREPRLQSKIDRLSGWLSEIRKHDRSDPETIAAKKRHEADLKLALAEKEAAQDLNDYSAQFTPGMKAPVSIAEQSEDPFTGFQKESGLVSDDFMLAYFSTDFHAFWKKHGTSYLSIHAVAEKARSAEVEKKRKAGSKGPRTREEKKWTEHTKAFIDSLSNLENGMNCDTIQQLVGNFARRRVKDHRTQKDLEFFLGALCNAASHDTDVGGICEILKKSRVRAFKELTREEQKVREKKMADSDVKALRKGEVPECFRCFTSLTEEMVGKCLTLLKATLDKGIGKKIAKPGKKSF